MKRVHFLGIGGSGASAVANIAKAVGYIVTGCDKNPHNEFTKNFASDEIFTGHSIEHLEFQTQIFTGLIGSSTPEEKKRVDILAVTPAVYSLDASNKELKEAKRLGIEILTWQKFLGKYLLENKFVIAVAGTHGKSTTTAMIAQVLEGAHMDPTVELGAVIPKWQENYRVGKSKFFIIEADEFNDNFLSFYPDIAVITNIEMDHPEYFKDFEEYKASFLKFLYQVKGRIIANLSDPGVREVLEKFQKDKDKKYNPEIIDYAKSEINFPLKVMGEINKLNATAAFQMGLNLGIDSNTIRNALMGFTGISRRQELLGEFKEVKVFSDFGHHPTEIKKTIESFKSRFPDEKLVLIYEPHMYTRTKVLFDDFVSVFQNLQIDQVFITDIYASREMPTQEVSAQMLVEKIKDPNIAYLPKDEVVKFLKLFLKNKDVVVFMGAGDIDKLGRELVGIQN